MHQQPLIVWLKRVLVFTILFGATTFQLSMAQSDPTVAEKPQADPDGTLHLPAMEVPLSNYLSAEARAYMIQRLTTPGPSFDPDIVKYRASIEEYLRPMVERSKQRYPSEISKAVLGGVEVYAVTPKGGVDAKNTNRILINLHGGAFSLCAYSCAMLESIPIAGVGKIKVVSVQYRQAPEYKFPAASEDVASVYRALLKQYRPENIGIYGCSAGGMLTAESIAWFQKEKLPRPGAVGIHCSSAVDFGGDAAYAAVAFDGAPVPKPSAADKEGHRSAVVPWDNFGYFSNVNSLDPLVQPGRDDHVLELFPPTLLVTGSRGFDLGGAIETHRRLVRLNVPAELHVWDGLPHGFLCETDLPESREVYNVIVKFFEVNLGKK